MSSYTKWYLFKVRRFLPVFLVQLLAAFNDNVFKNALIILFTYKISIYSTFSVGALIQIAGGIYILPFFLFTPLAGEIADKYDKAFIIRWTKIAEIAISLFAFVGFWVSNVQFLLALLFLMGIHSAFFGPLKYSILAQELSSDELLSGNSFVEGSTFISILLGTALGGLLIVAEYGEFLVPLVVCLVAIMGFFISLAIPNATPGSPHLKIHWNPLTVAYQLQRSIMKDRQIGSSVYGITWLWVEASILLYSLPVINKEIMYADAHVTTMLLFCFAVGMAIGSLLCNRVLNGEISTRYVGISILINGLLFLDLGWLISTCSASAPLSDQNLIGVKEFLHSMNGVHLALVSILISLFGGFFSVPLYALLQHRAPKEERARIIAALNINTSFFMVLGAMISALMLQNGFSLAQVMVGVGLICFVVAGWSEYRFR